jgi:predicted small lipoprotein YifL
MQRAIDKRKEIVAVAVIAAMLSLAACGGSSKAPSQTANSEKTSSTQSQSNSSSQTKSAETQSPSRSAEEARAKRVLVARIAGTRNLVQCLRAHGVHVPPQNLAKGFSAKGVDSTSKQFRQAYPGCLRASVKVYHIALQD